VGRGSKDWSERRREEKETGRREEAEVPFFLATLAVSAQQQPGANT
jgi:hypothetical protein